MLSLTNQVNTNSTSNATLTGHMLTYTVPTGANRILVNWNFECIAPTTILSPNQLYATMAISGGTAVSPNDDSVMCQLSDVQTTSLQRTFDVTPGSTVTVSMQARVSNGTGGVDDSYIVITAGRQ